MSQAFTSSGVGARPTPYFGACASIPPAIPSAISSILHIVHSSIGRDFPDCDAVVVILRVGSARFEQRLARGLNVPGFIGAARLHGSFLTVPLPRHAEARESPGQAGLVELGRVPGLAAVRRNLDAIDAAAAGP